MTTHRHALPQLGGGLFLTDGGIETTLIYLEGLALPDFAAFHLLRAPGGEQALRKYFATYAAVAEKHEAGLLLESPTWRASADWGARLGYGRRDLLEANQKAIGIMEQVRDDMGGATKAVISGCIGPRGDGYVPGKTMTEREAADYHADQARAFADSAADMISAITMNYVEEAIGIARAAEHAGMPVAISFTVETDGRLPTGQRLGEAIVAVDAATSGYPAYYMVNCAHPTHFDSVLQRGEPWTARVRGVRANASRMSHAQLNEATELDSGHPEEFGLQHAALKKHLPQLCVMGGCCGTDHRHVDAIAEACAPLFAAR